jgi:hypothetical protein
MIAAVSLIPRTYMHLLVTRTNAKRERLLSGPTPSVKSRE